MRDILLSLFIAGLLPVIVARPAVGAVAWVWISMMNPHTLTYGFAYSVPWAQMIALATLVGFLFTSRRHPMPLNGGTALLATLMLWVCVTSLFAMNPNRDEVVDRVIFAFKILFMLFVTFMLLRGRRAIDWLVWTMVVSVGFYGIKGGIWTLATGGGGRVWGPPGGNLADNNALAVGLVIVLPWMYYLRETASRAWIKHAMLPAMVIVGFAILGSQSRGALLAVLAMTTVLGIKAGKAFRTIAGLAVVGVIAITFMPDSWTQRMDTIQSYEEDTSAMSRIWTWKTLWAAALDHPIVGAGFRADNPLVFSTYAPMQGFEVFEGKVFVAHSIYLQVLGEHGFVGLFIYLSIGVWTWMTASALARRTKDDPEFKAWVPALMRMTQVSLTGFAIGGAFLSLMLLDLSFYIPGVVILVHATVTEAQRRRTTPAPSVSAGGAMADPAGTPHHVLPRRPTS